MKESIVEMLKIEAEAKKIVAAAGDEAEGIIREARSQAAARQDEAQRNIQEKCNQLVKEGVEQARRKREEQLEQVDRENGRLRQVPDDKAQAARALVLAALTGESLQV